MALSWQQLPPEITPLFIKYEELIAGHCDFRRLESVLALKRDEGRALAARVGATGGPPLADFERDIINQEARAGMQAFGYLP